MDKEVFEESKKRINENKIGQSAISEEEAEQVKELMDEAQMPYVFKDEDFKMAMGELDIRELNDQNFKQVLFRLVSCNLTYQRQIAQMLVDIERLMMILISGRKVRPEEIANELNDLIAKLEKASNNKIN